MAVQQARALLARSARVLCFTNARTSKLEDARGRNKEPAVLVTRNSDETKALFNRANKKFMVPSEDVYKETKEVLYVVGPSESR